MQQVAELFFVTTLGVRLRGPNNAQARFFKHANDVIRRRLALSAELRNQLAADLLDFGRSETGVSQTSSHLQNQRLLRGRSRVRAVVGMAQIQERPRCFSFLGWGSGGGASPARRWR